MSRVKRVRGCDVIWLKPREREELRQLWRRVKRREKRQRPGASGVPHKDTGHGLSAFKARRPAVLR